MIIDIFFGLVFAVIGKMYNLPNWQCVIIFLSSLALDGDILLNEFWRWLKEKKSRILTLDEFSYQHKFILHLPLLVMPLLVFLSLITGWFLFFGLITATIISHLVHDTVDKNFDGVRWLFPFNAISYKIRWKKGRLLLEKKDATQLAQEAGIMAKNARKSKKILRDNLFLCL